MTDKQKPMTFEQLVDAIITGFRSGQIKPTDYVAVRAKASVLQQVAGIDFDTKVPYLVVTTDWTNPK